MKNKALAARPAIAPLLGALLFSATLPAQVGTYLGPAVLSRGAGTVGTRGGETVALRFGGSAMGFYDTGILPLATDAKGLISEVQASPGVEANLFAFGTHQWRHAALGLDYSGNFRHYVNNSKYDNSDQMLTLGYTLQKSQRLLFDFKESAGTLSRGNSGLGGIANVQPGDSVDPNSLLLFDSRATYVQSSMDVSYLLSPRTAFRVGGQGFLVQRSSSLLIGVKGYALQGSLLRRVSRETTVGLTYQHSHYDFPKSFGEADINSIQATYARSIGKLWEFNVQAGIFQVEAQGLQRITFDPAIAAILGVTSGVQVFYRKSIFPEGEIALTRRFKDSKFDMRYGRGFNPGNGVYQTSREEHGSATFTYQGTRKASLSVLGGYSKMIGVGQTTGSYQTINGGASVTYALTRAVGLVARYDARNQQIDNVGLAHVAYRVSFGITFSPGTIPITLW